MSNELEFIQNWYLSNCDSDWEHGNGISITNIDNPGWCVEISLEDTDMEDKPFEKINKCSRNLNDWIYCEKKETKYFACGGPTNLVEILRTFIDWVNKFSKSKETTSNDS